VNDGSAISLTFYELGNSAWKLCSLLKSTGDEVRTLLAGSLRLLDKMVIIDLDQSDMFEILKLSMNKRITFYDSSYTYATKMHDLVFVTDDNLLAKVSSGKRSKRFHR
jgi:predicted nucleic acid-binding protein